ncbi:hypothetical protein AAGS61_10090 [Lysinibacillus sp. KU-BSD001]|uniref:hypothetical protein n=1 Tax=Lysinibacillus sp. KU-BSD001 TaxID=3141328 RepID=UPI0036EC6B5E
MGIRHCNIVKSSGLLANLSEEALLILINVVNLNKNDKRRVKVEVFDWTSNKPIEIPLFSFNGPDSIVGNGGPIKIKEGTAAVFFTDFLDDKIILIYEIRVTFLDSDENVFVTSNGISRINSANVTGQTVLDTDFRTLDWDKD